MKKVILFAMIVVMFASVVCAEENVLQLLDNAKEQYSADDKKAAIESIDAAKKLIEGETSEVVPIKTDYKVLQRWSDANFGDRVKIKAIYDYRDTSYEYRFFFQDEYEHRIEIQIGFRRFGSDDEQMRDKVISAKNKRKYVYLYGYVDQMNSRQFLVPDDIKDY